jgi:hypothetical protein
MLGCDCLIYILINAGVSIMNRLETDKRMKDAARMAAKAHTGKRYSSLVIISVADETIRNGRDCIVLCDCGNKRTVRLRSVTTGLTKSCGCRRIAEAKINIQKPRNQDKEVKGINHSMDKQKHPTIPNCTVYLLSNRKEPNRPLRKAENKGIACSMGDL